MKLRCINIPTPDAKRFAKFYQKTLGAKIDESHGGPNRIEIWFEDNDENKVLLVATQDTEYSRPKTTACHGFEFQVENIDKEYKRIIDLGIEVKESPKDLPWGFRYFNFKDPDGNRIDIVQAL